MSWLFENTVTFFRKKSERFCYHPLKLEFDRTLGSCNLCLILIIANLFIPCSTSPTTYTNSLLKSYIEKNIIKRVKCSNKFLEILVLKRKATFKCWVCAFFKQNPNLLQNVLQGRFCVNYWFSLVFIHLVLLYAVFYSM